MPIHMTHTEGNGSPAKQRPYRVIRNFSEERTVEAMLINLVKAHSQ